MWKKDIFRCSCVNKILFAGHYDMKKNYTPKLEQLIKERDRRQ